MARPGTQCPLNAVVASGVLSYLRFLSNSGLAPAGPKLLDLVKNCVHDKPHSVRKSQAYVYSIHYVIRYSGRRHPMDMGAAEVKSLLSHLTTEQHVSVFPYKHALCTLLFCTSKAVSWISLG